MGSIIEKLNYLKETSKILDGLLASYYGGGIVDKNFREKMCKCRDFLEFAHAVAFGRLMDFKKGIDELGEYEIRVTEAPETPIKLTINICRKNASNDVGEVQYLDLSKMTSCTLISEHTTFITLALSKKFTLKTFALNIYSATDMFSRGLILGEYAETVYSSWLSTTMTTEKVVRCKKDFYGNMYLSKIAMSADTMIKLFENLKDLTTTGKSYTFNVGSTNLAKLTEEQKDIARKKGWTLT